MRPHGLSWLLGVVLFLVGCELFLHLLPVSTATMTDYYLAPNVLTYPPKHEWTTSTGWDLRNAQRQRANNAGFLAHRDFERNPEAVALIGDSFVEASMLSWSERPDAQLEQALDGRPVYAFGGPGSALLDYAERIQLARERFGIRDVVILMERGDVVQSLCGSGNNHGPCLDRRTLALDSVHQPPPGWAKRALRHSALLQYLFGQLKLDPGRLWQAAKALVARDTEVSAGGGRDPGSSEEDIRRVPDAVARVFFDRIRGILPGRLVIVIDANRLALEAGETPVDPARDHFIGLARAAGAVVVDAGPLFQAHLRESVLKLGVGPYDAHLNAAGVRILMRAAAAALRAPRASLDAEG